WNRWVLGFNAARQNDLFNRMGLDRMSTPMLAVIVVLAALLAIVPIAFLLRGLGQSRVRWSREQRYWRQLVKKLNQRCFQQQSDETVQAFAHRVAPYLINAEPWLHAAHLFNQLRYARPTEANEQRLEALQRIAQQWTPEYDSNQLNSLQDAKLNSRLAT
ncbi:MAG: DUF4129 domain-containing protein, partial [Pseudomonadota bacterium]